MRLAAHARSLQSAGIAAEAPLALSRPVEESRRSALHPGASCRRSRRRVSGTFLCQHHTRDIVWRPEYQGHAVGAREIESIAVDAPDPARYARLFDGLPVKFSTAAAPAVTALRIRVEDRADAAAALRRGGFLPAILADGALAVSAGQAHGIALIFD